MSPRLLMACLLATLVGCGQQKSASPPPGQPTADGAVSKREPSVAKPEVDAAATAADKAQIAAVLNELTQAVRKCAVEQRRAPKNLEDLVANGYLSSVPPAPAGKKYAIDKNLQVYLANR
jgi:competence protein ComGC